MSSRWKLLGRWLLGMVGISIMSVGVALVTQAGLGTTSISAFPLVLSYISGLTFGETTLIFNIFMFLLQIVLLRKNFKWVVFLQIPMTMLFAGLLDVAMQHTMALRPETYWQGFLLTMIGNAVLALGVALEVKTDILLLPGEGAVWAIAFSTNKPFPTIKIAHDVTLVASATILSFVFLASLQGVREGTIISAFTVGLFVKLWLWLINLILRCVGDQKDNA